MNIKQPLDGILVADFTQALSGPYCTMMMADNGARVIKIERKGIGDMLRDAGPYDDKHNSLYFAAGNRGKESLSLDLNDSKDKELVWEIIKKADVLVENFRPGVMDKLGFSYDDVKAVNSKIIYASISAFGHTGEHSQEPGFDMIAQGYSGILSVNGEKGGDPVSVGVSIGDLSGGMFAYMSIMTALFGRAQYGEGTRVDVAMLDSLFAMLPPEAANYLNCGKITGTRGNTHPSIAPFGVINTKDGKMVIAVLGQKIWLEYCDAIGKPELANDPRFANNEARLKNREELRALTRPRYKELTTNEWIKIFQGYGVPCGLVNNIKEACDMKQIMQRNMICQAGEYRLVNNPMKMSNYEDKTIRGNVPKLGENTDKVRSEFLGDQ